MSNIQIFKNKDLKLQMRTMRNEDGSISINAEDTAIGFGWTQNKNGKAYVKWERINGFLSELDFSPLVGKDDFIPESLFYMLGMKANNKLAQAFQKWLARDVIPSIRKHGGYLTPETIEKTLTDPDFIIKLATELKEERLKRTLAEEKIIEKESEIKLLKPKADYYDLILQSKDLITITQIAKDYGMSAQEMNTLLHDLKVQYKLSDQWLLYAKHQSEGYTSSQTITRKHKNGTPFTLLNTKWTQKGRLFLYNLLKSKCILPLIERTDI